MGCWQRLAAAALASFFLLVGGCVSTPPVGPDVRLTQPLLLANTPFFPQRAYQCGPAALATVLAHQGVDTTPEALVDAVWLPGRRGSVAIELAAATRRNGLGAYLLEPEWPALLRALEHGTPVLVFLDLGYGPFHAWHFAVVIGADPDRQHVILRSGTQAERRMPLDGFVQAWRKAERWAMTAVATGNVPAYARPEQWLAMSLALQQAGQQNLSDQALRAGTGRWPRDAQLQFAYGNRQYALGNSMLAQAAFQSAVHARPDWVPPINNLASILLELGCADLARQTLDQVPADAWLGAFSQSLAATRASVEAAQSAQPGDCPIPASALAPVPR